jgi:hypothetical protein
MRKFLLIWLFFFTAPIIAQLPQFPSTSITTSITDLTCGGVATPTCASWPMPTIPGQGNSWFDPIFGTTTWELSVPAQNTYGNVVPAYSRVQGFSSDNHYLIMSEGNGPPYTDLYDATTTPPTPINRILTTDGSIISAASGDVNWANSLSTPTRLYYIPFGDYPAGAGLQLRYVDISSCTSSSCTLSPVTVHTFSCSADSYAPSPITPGTAGNQIETGSGAQGGMFDSTDTYFSFTCDFVNGNGRAELDWIRYNKSTDTVTTQEKWYNACPGATPSGCYTWTNWSGCLAHQGYNMIRMNQHPSASYITVIWQCGSYPWSRGGGTEAFGPTYNFLGPISANNIHQDNGFDVNGVPVNVMVQGDSGTTLDYYALTVTNLTTLSPTAITSKQIQVPCTFAYAPTCSGGSFLGFKSWHVSMTGTWGSVPGYALVSTLTTNAGASGGFPPDLPAPTTLGTAVSSTGSQTVTPGSMSQIGMGVNLLIDVGSANVEAVTVTAATSTTFTANFTKTHPSTAPVSNLSVGDTGWGAMENIAVKIDTTAANQSSASFWRLGRTMSIRDTDYGAEPHTFVNRDWTAYVGGSNWNADSASGGGNDNGYYTKLAGGSAPPAGVGSAWTYFFGTGAQ